MPVYTVHASMDYRIAARGGDGFIFVRDGFTLCAAIFGPFWLAAHRLWLALIGWIVVMVALNAAIAASGGALPMLLADLLLALLLGFEAASLERWTLSRRHWRQLDLVVAADQEQAERRFFDRWTTTRGFDDAAPAVDRGGPPPTRDIPGQPFSQPPSRDPIIGLFPEPGGSR